MDRRGWLMLRVFINRFNPKASHALQKFLPEEDRNRLQKEVVPSADLNPLLEQPQYLLSRTHYSWLEPLIVEFPPHLRPLVTSSLNLSKESVMPAVVLAPVVKNFFFSHLYQLLGGPEHLPVEYLPTHELSELLNWNKNQLVSLINFLGLHDLAAEMRSIVDKNLLKKIYACLGADEFYYLKTCLQQKESLQVPKLGLDFGKQSRTSLQRILQKRGILRLGKACSGQHPDFIWSLSHIFDIGRGKLLLEASEPIALAKITPLLKDQLLNLITFLKSTFVKG